MHLRELPWHRAWSIQAISHRRHFTARVLAPVFRHRHGVGKVWSGVLKVVSLPLFHIVGWLCILIDIALLVLLLPVDLYRYLIYRATEKGVRNL